MHSIKIAGREVGAGQPCFIIAEIGINHNGSLDIAKKLIDVAVEAGCQAVKFQKRDVETVYSEQELRTPRLFDACFVRHAMERSFVEGIRRRILPDEALARLMVEPHRTLNGDLKYALEFGLKEFDEIDQYCKKRGILWFASAWDGLSAHFVNGFDVPCHKIASACLTHDDLLVRVHSNRKPMILSTGGSTMEQIRHAVSILGIQDLVLLHCVASYPCRDEDVNLGVIDTLHQEFPEVPIGYSGHEDGILPSLVALVKGACVVERHITLDRFMPGSDHKASLNPTQLTELVSKIRSLETGLTQIADWVDDYQYQLFNGDGVKRVLTAEEAVMKKLRRK